MKMVIMAGGQGTRFWPLSRRDRPKQFLNVLGEKSLFQLTVERLKEIVETKDIFVICSEQYVPLVLSQAPEIGEGQIIVEPAPRNTAACIGLAAVWLSSRFPHEMMGVFPSDHLIMDTAEFRKVTAAAGMLAERGYLVTFGIKPEFPSTGYGYLEQGAIVDSRSDKEAFQVARFTEKPDRKTAEEFFTSGHYFWNSGMFVWSLSSILEEIRTHMPGLSLILDKLGDCEIWTEKEKNIFRSAESLSIDYGVMEKSSRVVMVPCDLKWSDVGDWNAVAEIQSGVFQDNSPGGSALQIDSRNCFVHSSGNKKIALVGVNDLILVETEDSILVCSRNKSQDVGKIVQILKKENPELV